MVDLLNVNALPEAGDWPETVPQLENGWYPTGGVVDPANDEGLLNWPNRELARRSLHNRGIYKGWGIKN